MGEMKMTERPEDYAPPKQRQVAAEALKAVDAALNDVKEAAQIKADEPEPSNVQDYAITGSQAISRYFEAAAVHIEQTAAAIMKEAEHGIG
jgi:hypothetical protein